MALRRVVICNRMGPYIPLMRGSIVCCYGSEPIYLLRQVARITRNIFSGQQKQQRTTEVPSFLFLVDLVYDRVFMTLSIIYPAKKAVCRLSSIQIKIRALDI